MKIQDTLFRVFVDENKLEDTIKFYEKLYQEKCKLKFSYPEIKLELAQVSHCLIIAGDPKARRLYEHTKLTMIVKSIHIIAEALSGLGAIILKEPKRVPTGWNMLVQHPDGIIVEYVEHIAEQVSVINEIKKKN